MSTPTGQFSSLSIRDPAGTDTDIASDPETTLASGGSAMTRSRRTELSAVNACSGLVYDLRSSGLDRETEARALLGLTTDFEVLFCGLDKEGYEFAFGGRVRVRIDLDEEEEVGEYTCSCAVFEGRRDVACQHIFWLLDQLRGHLVSAPPTPSRILLSRDGHAQGFPRIERFLFKSPENTTLEMLAGKLDWPYLPFAGEEGGMSRTQRVRDILSAFSTTLLPEEFRLDLAEFDEHAGRVLRSERRGGKRTPEQCVVQGDFEATLFRLAVHDDSVFASLCKAMPPGACAVIYFDKVLERSKRALAAFDNDCETLKPGTKEGETSLDTILETLTTSAANIHRNLFARAPHGLQGAAEALTTLLEDVSARNKDALAANRYGRISFSTESPSRDEDEDDRNLYHQLIGDEDDDAEDKHFCLDALADIPAEDLFPFRERLEAVLHRVEVNRAPKGFIMKLAGIVRAAEKESVGARKRGGRSSTGEGEVERRKRIR